MAFAVFVAVAAEDFGVEFPSAGGVAEFEDMMTHGHPSGERGLGEFVFFFFFFFFFGRVIEAT